MKTCVLLIALSCFAGSPAATPAESTFINLNFKESYLPPETTGYEPVAIALPAWTVLRGTNVERQYSLGGQL